MKLTYFEEPTNCSTDADCHVIHAFSVCALIDEPKLLPLPVNNSTLSHVVTALTSICRCDDAWTKEEGRCCESVYEGSQTSLIPIVTVNMSAKPPAVGCTSPS